MRPFGYMLSIIILVFMSIDTFLSPKTTSWAIGGSPTGFRSLNSSTRGLI